MIRHWTRHLKTEQRPGRAAPDVSAPALINAIGLDVHRRRAGDRADHQVPRRRLDHDPRDGRLLPDHARHPRPLRQRRAPSSPPTRRTRSSRPGCTRSCWSPSCTSRPCGRWPSPRPPGPTCSRASTSPPTRSRPTGCWRSGTSATSAYRSRCCTRRTASWSSRSSTTPWRSRRPTRAASSRSTSRSTSSAAGGSSCCTTRPRCGSRAGCCSPPASWSPRCPTSSGPPRSRASARSASRARVRARRPAPRQRPRARPTPSDRQVAAMSRTPASPQGPRCARGSAQRSRPRSARSRTAATASSGSPRRPGRARVVFVRHADPRRAGGRRDHRGHRGRHVLARRRRRGARAVARTGSSRRARFAGPGLCGGCDFQHVDARAAARAQGGRGPRAAGPPGQARRPRHRRGRSPATRTGCAGAPGMQYAVAPRRPARACASTAPARSSRSTTA